MKLVFFSNLLNHHQVELCDQFYKIYRDDFCFVELSSLTSEREQMGFKSYERGYKLNGQQYRDKALDLARNAEIAIMGAESFEFLKIRISKTNKITFSYSERWLKKGVKNLFSPAILRQIILYLKKGKERPWYLLCASGFLSKDVSKLHLFKNRCFKWGYFPKYNFEISQLEIKDNKIKILWVGRFLNWKHPESMISLAKSLHVSDYNFSITMIGDGPEMESIRCQLETQPELREYISLLGNQPNDIVIEQMQQSHIFCFTSDRQEGWGAVLGEAMANGCCPVASSTAGATPFLVKDGYNGLIYQSGIEVDLIRKVKYLIENPIERYKMATEAKNTMKYYWNAVVASKNFLALSESLLMNQSYLDFKDEPCASC